MLFAFTDLISTPLLNVAGAVIVPMQTGVSRIGESLSRKKDEVVNIRDVMSQNQELRSQVDALVIENNSLQQDKYELNQLRQLYELDRQYEAYEKIGAHVVSRDPGNWFSGFVIDTADGAGGELIITGGGFSIIVR